MFNNDFTDSIQPYGTNVNSSSIFTIGDDIRGKLVYHKDDMSDGGGLRLYTKSVNDDNWVLENIINTPFGEILPGGLSHFMFDSFYTARSSITGEHAHATLHIVFYFDPAISKAFNYSTSEYEDRFNINDTNGDYFDTISGMQPSSSFIGQSNNGMTGIYYTAIQKLHAHTPTGWDGEPTGPSREEGWYKVLDRNQAKRNTGYGQDWMNLKEARLFNHFPVVLFSNNGARIPLGAPDNTYEKSEILKERGDFPNLRFKLQCIRSKEYIDIDTMHVKDESTLVLTYWYKNSLNEEYVKAVSTFLGAYIPIKNNIYSWQWGSIETRKNGVKWATHEEFDITYWMTVTNYDGFDIDLYGNALTTFYSNRWTMFDFFKTPNWGAIYDTEIYQGDFVYDSLHHANLIKATSSSRLAHFSPVIHANYNNDSILGASLSNEAPMSTSGIGGYDCCVQGQNVLFNPDPNYMYSTADDTILFAFSSILDSFTYLNQFTPSTIEGGYSLKMLNILGNSLFPTDFGEPPYAHSDIAFHHTNLNSIDNMAYVNSFIPCYALPSVAWKADTSSDAYVDIYENDGKGLSQSQISESRAVTGKISIGSSGEDYKNMVYISAVTSPNGPSDWVGDDYQLNINNEITGDFNTTYKGGWGVRILSFELTPGTGVFANSYSIEEGIFPTLSAWDKDIHYYTNFGKESEVETYFPIDANPVSNMHPILFKTGEGEFGSVIDTKILAPLNPSEAYITIATIIDGPVIGAPLPGKTVLVATYPYDDLSSTSNWAPIFNVGEGGLGDFIQYLEIEQKSFPAPDTMLEVYSPALKNQFDFTTNSEVIMPTISNLTLSPINDLTFDVENNVLKWTAPFIESEYSFVQSYASSYILKVATEPFTNANFDTLPSETLWDASIDGAPQQPITIDDVLTEVKSFNPDSAIESIGYNGNSNLYFAIKYTWLDNIESMSLIFSSISNTASYIPGTVVNENPIDDAITYQWGSSKKVLASESSGMAVHYGLGGTSIDIPKWAGIPSSHQWGEEQNSVVFDDAELKSLDSGASTGKGFTKLIKLPAVDDYLIGFIYGQYTLYKVNIADGSIIESNMLDFKIGAIGASNLFSDVNGIWIWSPENSRRQKFYRINIRDDFYNLYPVINSDGTIGYPIRLDDDHMPRCLVGYKTKAALVGEDESEEYGSIERYTVVTMGSPFVYWDTEAYETASNVEAVPFTVIGDILETKGTSDTRLWFSFTVNPEVENILEREGFENWNANNAITSYAVHRWHAKATYKRVFNGSVPFFESELEVEDSDAETLVYKHPEPDLQNNWQIGNRGVLISAVINDGSDTVGEIDYTNESAFSSNEVIKDAIGYKYNGLTENSYQFYDKSPYWQETNFGGDDEFAPNSPVAVNTKLKGFYTAVADNHDVSLIARKGDYTQPLDAFTMTNEKVTLSSSEITNIMNNGANNRCDMGSLIGPMKKPTFAFTEGSNFDLGNNYSIIETPWKIPFRNGLIELDNVYGVDHIVGLACYTVASYQGLADFFPIGIQESDVTSKMISLEKDLGVFVIGEGHGTATVQGWRDSDSFSITVPDTGDWDGTESDTTNLTTINNLDFQAFSNTSSDYNYLIHAHNDISPKIDWKDSIDNPLSFTIQSDTSGANELIVSKPYFGGEAEPVGTHLYSLGLDNISSLVDDTNIGLTRSWDYGEKLECTLDFDGGASAGVTLAAMNQWNAVLENSNRTVVFQMPVISETLPKEVWFYFRESGEASTTLPFNDITRREIEIVDVEFLSTDTDTQIATKFKTAVDALTYFSASVVGTVVTVNYLISGEFNNSHVPSRTLGIAILPMANIVITTTPANLIAPNSYSEEYVSASACLYDYTANGYNTADDYKGFLISSKLPNAFGQFFVDGSSDVASYGSSITINTPLTENNNLIVVTPGEEASSNSEAKFDRENKYRYKASLMYDRNQESPLSAGTATFKGEDDDSTDNGNGRDSLKITINMYNVSKRCDRINIYRADAEYDLYRLVTSIKLDDGWALEVTPDGEKRSLTFYDVGKKFKSYEAANGIAEELKRNIIYYGLSTQLNGYLYVADCFIPETQERVPHYIYRSKVNRFDTFDWVHDYGVLPEKPTAIKSFMGRIFAFTNNITYIINPSSLTVDDTWEGVGCLGPKAVIVTDDGMAFFNEHNIYLSNGTTVQKIGDDIQGKIWSNYPSNVASNNTYSKNNLGLGYSPEKQIYYFYISDNENTGDI